MNNSDAPRMNFRPDVEQLPPERWVYRVFPSVCRPAYKRDRLTTSFHEAGHCILWVALGGEIESAELTETGGITKKYWPELLRALGEKSQDQPAPAKQPKQQESCSDKKARQENQWRSSTWMAADSLAGRQAEMILHGFQFTGALFEHTSDAKAALWHIERAALPLCSVGYCQLITRSVLTLY